MKRAGARPLEDMERNRPKHADSNFYQAKKGEQRNGARPRQPAAGQAAKSQGKEKSGDDHSHRLNVNSENREKGSLPNDLIDQRREARRKKRRNNHRIQRRFTGSIVLRQSTCHAVPRCSRAITSNLSGPRRKAERLGKRYNGTWTNNRSIISKNFCLSFPFYLPCLPAPVGEITDLSKRSSLCQGSPGPKTRQGIRLACSARARRTCCCSWLSDDVRLG